MVNQLKVQIDKTSFTFGFNVSSKDVSVNSIPCHQNKKSDLLFDRECAILSFYFQKSGVFSNHNPN